MSEVYRLFPEMGEFSEAGEAFFELVESLQSQEASHWEHGQAEEFIEQRGREVLRLAFQGYLNRRASQEERRHQVLGSDGVERERCWESSSRALGTLFGEVKITRKRYSGSKAGSLFPLEAELNLAADKYSDGLRKRVSQEASRSSFDEALASLQEAAGQKIPKRQAEELTAKVAMDFEAFYQSRSGSEPEEKEDLLVLTFDGKGVVMRQEDLREATRRAAEREEGKRIGRLAPGEKRNRKRMAAVASVYSLSSLERSPEEIMGLWPSQREGSRPKPVGKRVWASLQREPEEVIEEAFQEALWRDPQRKRQWVVLVDGDEHQLERIEKAGKKYEVDLVIILDFIHVLEYLWKAAYCFHPVGSAEAEEWVQWRAVAILRGDSSQVASGMRRSATLRQLKNQERKAVDKCADYLIKYRQYLRYNLYCWNGWPIATGVIEGACRHLVKDRMELTGARWGLKTAEAILKIRALRSSGDWEDYWQFHKQQELQRNHLDRYAEDILEPAA